MKRGGDPPSALAPLPEAEGNVVRGGAPEDRLDIWAACREAALPGPLGGTVLRLVESQEQVATNRIVRGLEEQALLEEMLEATKPPVPAEAARLHYLLATPFRYPPLRYGSRFGSRHEASLFYAARKTSTVLAEAAYYRFVFWHGMETPPAAAFNTQHTLFACTIRSARGLRLQDPPFAAFRAVLTHPADYGATQRLGTALRAAGIEAFEYVSARDREGGLNVALFTPAALASRRPTMTQEWLCETRGETVHFYGAEERAVHRFGLSDFAVEGVLPMPAA